jgi:hypothetical protein
MSVSVSLGGQELVFTRGLLLAVLVLGGAVGYGGYTYVQQGQAIETSVPVDATVTDTSVTEVDGRRGETRYDPGVTFTYRYNGTNYTASNIFPGFAQDYEERSKAREVIAPYTVGEPTTAYVPPDSPAEAFLERQRTSTPLLFAGLGVLGLLWVVGLAATKELDVGQGVELRPVEEVPLADRPGSVLGIDHDRLEQLLKRTMAVSTVVGFLSVCALALVLVTMAGGLSGPPIQVQPELFGPVGFPFLLLVLSWTVLTASVLGYGLWSLREYRSIRRRIVGSPPPSPFRHPLRLFAIVTADSADLDAHASRAKLTAVTAIVVVFLLAVPLAVLGII